MTTDNPQVPWTDEQWARVNQVIQGEASRARVAATFLPLVGPLHGGTDFVRKELISYSAPPPANVLTALTRSGGGPFTVQATTTTAHGIVPGQWFTLSGNAPTGYNGTFQALPNTKDSTIIFSLPTDPGAETGLGTLVPSQYSSAGVPPDPQRIVIDDRHIWQLATLKVNVHLRGAQMDDPEMTSALAVLRRAANVLARLEDAVVFNGLSGNPLTPTRAPQPQIWEITGGETIRGLFDSTTPWKQPVGPPVHGPALVEAVSLAIGDLENRGHFGPFAVVLGQILFGVAQDPTSSLVLPQDRIIPFLGGGPLLRSSTLQSDHGVVVALGGAPVELIVAKDMHLQFLQRAPDANFLFRVSERMVLRIKEPEAIDYLYPGGSSSSSSRSSSSRSSSSSSSST
jgi:uncharacterized linocin/CFP29 family protein